MSVPVLVLNFGHSVLRSLSDYTQAASEIYRHYAKGYNIVAVTSAQGDQTDVLMAEARRIGPGDEAKNLAELICLGEKRSAALLALALERVGAPAYVRQARDLGLRADGTGANARLVDLNVEQLLLDLKNHDIVVMPGFVAIGDNDRPALLGQGGADLTALYVAQKLGTRALLLKDIDGVYQHDPKREGDAPLRFGAISHADMESLNKGLIAPRALAFAKKNGQNIELGKPGSPFVTEIGGKTASPTAPHHARILRVAMLGCGTVGGGVYRRMNENKDRFDCVKIMVRNVKKYTDQGMKADLLTTKFEDLLAAKPDVFIDVSGGIEPALSQTRAMLAAGVHVVSANKQAVAAGGAVLDQFAVDHNAMLEVSGTAGGGMPVLEMCKRERGRITRVDALLNGTTNFMLDNISAGMDYDAALKLAQDKGFAEADPSGDVDGSDAAAKIRLIARYGFSKEITLDDISRDTIDGFSAAKFNGRAKRVASCWVDETGEFHTALRLMDLQKDDFLAQAEGEEAHAVFTFDDGSQYRIRGKGAGRWPTTEAVMEDLYTISAEIAFS
ncbi:amino acid kinase family protein [Robiginitomaculum antarcticum]|uniref:amino acid kinase family protein n=1 Tax=Robiginitomaculum antarcticum TaxID=437507 RepID=UPI0003755BA2|nr:hypothetical protein [Robiginitomaculum antarcticum]